MMKKIENFYCYYYFYKKGKLNESKVQKGILFNLFSLLSNIPIKKRLNVTYIRWKIIMKSLQN